MRIPRKFAQPQKYDQTLARQLHQRLEEDEFINLLKGRTLFRNVAPTRLPLTTLEEISSAVEIMRLPKNRPLEFGPVDSLYEIISGYVKIYDRAPLGAEGGRQDLKQRRALLAWRVPGELLGDFSFAFPDHDPADQIVATDECQLLMIPTVTVRRLAQSYPQIYLNIAGNLAAKAIKTRVRALVLRLPNINSMIARIFLEFLAERGYDQEINRGRAKVVNGSFHVKDIAAFLGYKYHRTQSGVHALIEAKLLGHYPEHNKKSGRFVIRDEKRLRKYLEEQSKLSE
ncbi:MAG: Crp/Fnr family transcriptional regulator [Pyrinomonadaceae bacterium]